MKQGRATRDVREGQMVQPKPKGINPAGADQLGQKVAVRKAYEPLYSGRGYKATMSGHTSHKSGSQGKH